MRHCRITCWSLCTGSENACIIIIFFPCCFFFFFYKTVENQWPAIATVSKLQQPLHSGCTSRGRVSCDWAAAVISSFALRRRRREWRRWRRWRRWQRPHIACAQPRSRRPVCSPRCPHKPHCAARAANVSRIGVHTVGPPRLVLDRVRTVFAERDVHRYAVRTGQKTKKKNKKSTKKYQPHVTPLRQILNNN